MPMSPPTKYLYTFHNITAERSKEIELDSPLPHLEVGHELNVGFQDRSDESIDHLDGGPLVIRAVRLFLSTQGQLWKRYEIIVICEEQDSPFRL